MSAQCWQHSLSFPPSPSSPVLRLSASLFLPHSLSPFLSSLSVQRKNDCKWVPWTTGTPINKTVSQRCRKGKKKKKEGAKGALSLNISSPTTTTTTTTLTPYPHCQHPHPPLPSLFPPFFMPSPPSPSPPSCLHPSSPSCPLSYSLPLLHSNQSIIQTPPPGHPTTKTKWLRALFLGSLVREVGLTATRWKSHFSVPVYC